MSDDEGFFTIQPCPCCGYAPKHGEVEVGEDYEEELQECPGCGQESIALLWDTGDNIEEEY